MGLFKLKSGFKPSGDQPQAIEKLVKGVRDNLKHQTLMGVTGSGKTFTMANAIAVLGMPALVISHNKTLAAQLYQELKQFFPENAVEYFVSYYDYYQPESYIPQTDTYIEKDASINDRLDRLRLSATSSLLGRRDCVIVSSVSCIYNIGDPVDYKERVVGVRAGDSFDRDTLLKRLVGMKYERNDIEFKRGTFRVRGDVVEVIPAYEEWGVRIEFDGDTVDRVTQLEPTSGKRIKDLGSVDLYPASHFVTSEEKIQKAIVTIEEELKTRLAELERDGKLLEAQRLETRTRFDMEMMAEAGYCPGVENYSRHISGRPAGARPYCLIDYFKRPFLTIIDESHATLPQVRGMYNGDRSRKSTLVEHGFRLPSALDNRPLRFDEFEELVSQTLYMSATPGPYELEKNPRVIEQVIRPTGLVDPAIEVRKTEGQIDDLINEIRSRARRKERVLVTTLTKRMSEELCRYLEEYDLKVKYLHSEIKTLERVQILRSLRMREFDCLVGINLLREGLDLPEVSLVVILDADKEGFLRSEVSLIQTAGRAARHIRGHVIFYADRMTGSMQRAIRETDRRRLLQLEYNKKHGITPRGIQKAVQQGLSETEEARGLVRGLVDEDPDRADLRLVESELEGEMFEASRRLDFERAAKLRDELARLRKTVKGHALPRKTLRRR